MALSGYSGFLWSSVASRSMPPRKPASEALGQGGINSSWTTIQSDWRFWLAFVFLLSALYMAKELKRGWVPMDEGTLGLSAEYVLQGELPHRDYFEGYTGGLTYLNALAFRIFGTDSVSMRYVLYLFFLAWVPAVYYMGSRFVSAAVASALTFLAVAWGPPNYAAAMPSWYNLFFATFGLAALLRYIEVPKPRWLVIAGLCGGISFLFKQVGLYFIAAGLLFLFFREQVANTEKPEDGRRSHGYRIFLCVAVLLYEAFLLNLILKHPGIISVCYFLVPASLVGAVILWRDFFGFTKDRSHRFTFLFRELTLFAIGVAIPVAIFLVPFIWAGALSYFIRDVFILPGKQIAHTKITPTLLRFACGAAVDAVVVAGVFLAPPRFRRFTAGLALLGMPCGLFLARTMEHVYKAIWSTMWVVLPTIVIVGLLILVRQSSSNEMSSNEMKRKSLQKLFLMLSTLTLCSLIQFPFVTPPYLCYVAPLAVLAAAAVISFVSYRPRVFLVGAYCFALFYVVFEVTPGFVYAMGQQYKSGIQTVTVNVPHTGGLRTFPVRARTYEKLNAIIGQHARGEYIFATPDCPEMYFLYGFRNPTRFFFDFFDEAQGRTQRILATIREHNINLVVLNGDPLFSAPVPADLRSALEQEFPSRVEVGHFEVRWKP